MNYYQEYSRYRSIYYGGNKEFMNDLINNTLDANKIKYPDLANRYLNLLLGDIIKIDDNYFDLINFDEIDNDKKKILFEKLFNYLKKRDNCYNNPTLIDYFIKIKFDNIDNKFINEAIKNSYCSIIYTLFNIKSLKSKLDDEYINKINNDKIKLLLTKILYDNFTSKGDLENFLKKLLQFKNSYDYDLFIEYSNKKLFDINYSKIFIDNFNIDVLERYKLDVNIIIKILTYYINNTTTPKLELRNIIEKTAFDSDLVKFLYDKKVLKMEDLVNYVINNKVYNIYLIINKLATSKLIDSSIINIIEQSKIEQNDKIKIYHSIFINSNNENKKIDDFYKKKLDSKIIKELKTKYKLI